MKVVFARMPESERLLPKYIMKLSRDINITEKGKAYLITLLSL